MKYMKVEAVIAVMLASPVFSTTFGNRIYDVAPLEEPKEPFVVVSVISDPTVSSIQNRARVEVRTIFGKDKPQYEVRAFQETMDDFFTGSNKVFGDNEVYRIENDGRQFFIDEDLRRIAMCDYLCFYLR